MNASPSDRLLLPPGTRLIHIGPHKTGTTALQSAFHHNRVALAAQGVHYAGRGQQPAEAAIAVSQGRAMRGERQLGIEAWDRLVREIHAAGTQRVMVSSEFFSGADAAGARRVVEAVDHSRTHILITLRPLWKITPSQWQQFVQNGLRSDFEPWLRRLLARPARERPGSTFWRRHAHGALVRQWADVVGPDRVTVVAVDESDPSSQLRVVEQLLGLSTGTLDPHEDRTNRSLTRPEAELVRRLNRHYYRKAWSEETYASLVRRGAVLAMKRNPAYERAPRITLPLWSRAPLTQAAQQEIQTVEASGVRVVGDLAGLRSAAPETPASKTVGKAARKRIDPDTAASALLGVIEASGDVESSRAARLGDCSVRELGVALAGRTAGRARLRLIRTTARIRRGARA